MIQHTEELGHPLLEGPNSIPPAVEQPTPGEHHQPGTVCITCELDHPRLWAFTFTLSPFIVLAWLANSFFSRIIWVSALSRSPLHSFSITHFWKTIFLLLNWRKACLPSNCTGICSIHLIPPGLRHKCLTFLQALPFISWLPNSGLEKDLFKTLKCVINIPFPSDFHPHVEISPPTPEKTPLHSAQCSTWPSLSSFCGQTSPGLSSPALWRWLIYFSASCHPSCHSNSTTWLKLFPPCWSITL